MPSEKTSPSQPSQDRVLRFTLTERLLHWTHAVTFVILLASGAFLFFPKLSTLVQDRELWRSLHITAGLVFVFSPIALYVLGNRMALHRDIEAIETWDEEDLPWLRRAWRELVWRHVGVPQGRFNAGQKLNAIITAASVPFFGITGYMMWRWYQFPRWLVDRGQVMHDIMAAILFVLWLGHLYLVILNPKNRESLRGMVLGWVKLSWARESHGRWVEEKKAEPESLGKPPGLLRG